MFKLISCTPTCRRSTLSLNINNLLHSSLRLKQSYPELHSIHIQISSCAYVFVNGNQSSTSVGSPSTRVLNYFFSCTPTCSRSTVELNWSAGTSIFIQSSFCPRLSSRISSQRALILNLFVACISTCNRVTCALTLQHPQITIHSLHKLNAYLGFRLYLSLYIYLYLYIASLPRQ